MHDTIYGRFLTATLGFLCSLPAFAQAGPDLGKLTATGGVSQLEGAGGGGLSPWALITGYGSRDSWGGNAHLTSVRTQDYALDSAGLAVGIHDRVEFSLARQQFRGSLAPLDQLEKLKPDDIFRQLYQQRFGNDAPADTLSAFAELMLP